MQVQFEQLWGLLLLPLGLIAALVIDRFYGLQRHSLQRRVTLCVRFLLLCVLALAIAAPSVLLSSGNSLRWVLVDASDSAKDTRVATETTVAQALERLPANTQAGVIVFGREAMIETPMNKSPLFTGVHAQVGGEGSELDDALRFAAALLPTGSAGGLTVVTDGKATVADKTMDMLVSHGMKVDALIASPAQSADAQVSQLISPALVYEGQSVPLRVTVDASEAMQATLVLSQDGNAVATRQVTLQKGENRFAFSEKAEKTGVVTYEARVVFNGDSEPMNDRAAAFTRVAGAPNVLVVTENVGVERLLLATGMHVETVTPAELPVSADGYLPYDAILLNNIAYNAGTEKQWDALAHAVRTLGRGLTVLGGDSSYALGGYRGTALETLLPVSIDVKEKLRMPALSLVLVIDKSGSMTEGQFGSTRIEVAKEAAMSAAEVLNARDNIGVVGFDDTAKWVVPFQAVTDVAAIQNQIGTLRADGGTAFYAALEQAYQTLAAAETPLKHVILLSDGQPADSGFENIALAMQNAGITMTTVAVGDGANQTLMRLLSTLGGGRCYTVGEFDDVPKIFTKETMMVSGNYVQNRDFTPVITEKSALTEFEGFPALSGYLTTAEKSAATLSMVSDTDEPLLAWWHVGSGTVVAWTSDAEGAWTSAFLAWENMPRFISGMVAKTLPSNAADGTLETRIDGKKLHMVYSCKTGEGLETFASVIHPDGTESTHAMMETAPGQYEADIAAAAEGAYAIRVSQVNANGEVRFAQGGAVRGFSDEYDLRVQADGSLERLCAVTGGRLLKGSEDFWDTAVASAVARRSLRNMLCALALFLLLLDIALRKLPWEEWLPKKSTPKSSKRKPSRPKRINVKEKDQQKDRRQAAQDTAAALLNAKQARKRT